MLKKYFTADEAFRSLDQLIDYVKAFSKVEISEEQIEYCREWLFDCVHETGRCETVLPLNILNDSFKAFKEEN